MGHYLYKVLQPDRAGGMLLGKVLGPVERLLYRREPIDARVHG